MAVNLKNIISEKCPYCEKAPVFKKKAGLFQLPEMNACCENCSRDFTGEPGYFFGAMYVSYALAVALSIASFIVAWFIFDIRSFPAILGIIWAGIIISAIKNYKLSRVIWLKIFPPGKGTNFTSGEVSAE